MASVDVRARFFSLGLAGLAMLAGLLIPAAASARPKPAPKAAAAGAAEIWAATWEAAPEPARPPLIALSNQTVRQIAHISLGGIFVRVRLSNEFGDKPLTVGAAHVALAAGGGPGIQPDTDRPVTFGGKPQITIPPGARALSDPVSLTVPAMSDVAVSIWFPPQAESAVTSHYFAMQSGYVAAGNVIGAASLTPTSTINYNVVLSGLDVSGPRGTKVVVTLGDSLTGGFGSTAGANHRWPDLLSAKLAGRKIGVVNAAIGGNRLLHDFFGPNAMSRFDRDVLSQPSVGYLIVLLGINDFGLPGGRGLPAEEVSADEVIAGYRQLIARSHSYGIKVFIATIPPFGPIPERPGYYSDASEAKREAVNQWIRLNTKEFEGVVDFDAALKDPAAHIRMAPAFDSGDHLDPNDAGYAAMADAVEMRLFE
ncbi:MAG TPA: SGNH/GDSL hydrolase family protein [Caulobacteraceae bacterium]|nr:SGNH/GDSL hydrolase family protein [Caulobacteraceae bacterium]